MQPGSARERWTCSRLSFFDLFKTILRARSRFRSLRSCQIPFRCFASRRGSSCARKVPRAAAANVLVRTSGIGENIDAALGAVEPAIEHCAAYLAGVGNCFAELAAAAGRLRARGARPMPLAIGVMIGARVLPPMRGRRSAARCSATRRERFLGSRPVAPWSRLDDHLDVTVFVIASMQETEPAAQIAVACIALAALARADSFLRQARPHPRRRRDRPPAGSVPD